MPLPEDIALITGGFLAALGPPHGVGSVTAMVLVGLSGILVGDSVIFKAGHDYGEKLLETKLGRHISQERVERIRVLFCKHGPKFIIVARFLPGVRAVTYFVAGTSRVRYWKFLLYDGLAACASAPAWVLLGYWCGKRHMIRKAYDWAKTFQIDLLIGVAVVVVLIALVSFLRNRQAERRRLSAAAEQSGLSPRVGVEPPGGRGVLRMDGRARTERA
ncbi:MAG TPA: DedA family protein [Myxococcales bacterium]|nr:DedA family protein [Myxococcales bacterium]